MTALKESAFSRKAMFALRGYFFLCLFTVNSRVLLFAPFLSVFNNCRPPAHSRAPFDFIDCKFVTLLSNPNGYWPSRFTAQTTDLRFFCVVPQHSAHCFIILKMGWRNVILNLGNCLPATSSFPFVFFYKFNTMQSYQHLDSEIKRSWYVKAENLTSVNLMFSMLIAIFKFYMYIVLLSYILYYPV